MTPEEIREFARCARDPVYFLNNYGYVYDIKKSKVDKMSCFEYQEEAISNFLKYQNNIVLKSRQCLPEDTFIDTPDGPKAIQEFKAGDLVFSYDHNAQKTEIDTVYDSWESGMVECVRVKLKDTRSIYVGENHPFFVENKNKWVMAKDLEINDVILQRNHNFGEVSPNPSEVKILSYLLTDGSTIKQVKFTNNNPAYLDEFESCVVDVFPKLEVRKIPKLKGFDIFPHQKHGVNTKSPIMEWCENKSIAKKKAKDKNIPEEVFYWDKKSVSLFINRLFAGDGWISILKKEKNKRLELGIASPSIKFLEQVKFLLKKFDIKCNIYEVKNMKLQKESFFKLRITHSKSILRFLNEIGIYDKVTDEHIKIASSRKHDVKDTTQVRKVERIGKRKCFDISVTKNENYFVDGLLVHNTGLSVITAGFVVWCLLFKLDQRILIVANDGAGAIRFLGTVKQYFQFLPKFLYDPEKQGEKDNEKFFSIKNYEGKISWVKAVASSKNAGRGESLTMLILDETAFIENAEDIWMAAGLALSATQGKCIMISCVPEDTFVFTNNGLKQIKNFIKKEEKEGYIVDDYFVLGKDKLRSGNLFFNNGFQKTKKIFGTNSYLEGTYNHKIWACKNGVFDWFKLEDLNEGDYFSLQYGNQIFGSNDNVENFTPSINGRIKNIFNPKKITKEIAYIIGLYIAEGSVYKKYKNDKFIGGAVTITCGDNIGKFINDAGLTFSNSDGIHYCIGSKNFIEFLEFLGFDLRKKAKQKEIPSRVLEMSKDNIISMLKGMFDGDGCSRKDRGYISYTSSSKILTEQVRMLLLNMGVLTDFKCVETKPTKKVKVKSVRYCIEANAEYSKVFYDKIGFNLKRKQDNQIVLDKFNLFKNNTNDLLPNGLKLIQRIIKESKVELKELKKEVTQIYSLVNSKKEYKTNNINRKIVIKIYNICKKYLSNKTIEYLDRIISENLKWNKINKIQFSEKETYDFSLPENNNDFWCHSVLYNGILGHQTPQGTGNLYHRTWVGTKKSENDFKPFEIHWTQHPVYSQEMEQKIDDYGRNYWTSPWYEKECERLQYDRVKIAQELDLSFEGSRSLVIDSLIVEKYKRAIINEKPPFFYDYTRTETKDRFLETKTNFWVWKKPEHGRNYIFGGDVARGDSNDFSTLQVFDAETCEQVAEYQGKIAPDMFATLIDKVGRDYNDAYLVVECNSFGLATTLNLKNVLKYPPDKIYHSQSIKDIINPMAKIRVKENEEIPGIQTTTVTRPLIISSLNTYMREGKLKINSIRLLEEFDTFIYNGNKPEHADGFNDDLIFALGVLLFVRDTEYYKHFASKDLYKAMLGAISHQKTQLNDKINLENNKVDGTIQTSTKNKASDDDNDMSWLYGSMG